MEWAKHYGVLKKKSLELWQWEQLRNLAPSPRQISALIKHELTFVSPQDSVQIKRQHSTILDELFGFQLEKCEKWIIKAQEKSGGRVFYKDNLTNPVQTWVGLHVQTLQTTYHDIYQMLKILRPKKGQIFLDLGAAYGRMGIVLQSLQQEAHFLGLEYVPERVDEGNRIFKELGIRNAEMQTADLAANTFRLPGADVYFLYDYGSETHLRKTFQDLELMRKKRSFLLALRGKMAQNLLNRERNFNGTRIGELEGGRTILYCS